ncbi:MAG: hypothetical protein M0T75_02980 [Chloroflexi bacterium]|nr:hypothetical protein [Chloroflexota bacterium]
MDPLEILLAILIWLLVLGFALVRAPGTGGRSQIGAWLALSALTMFVVFVVFFVVCHVLLFTLGTGAATVGVVAAVVALEATPITWALILRRRGRDATAQG